MKIRRSRILLAVPMALLVVLAASLLNFVMIRSDLWILAAFRGPEDVAIYGAAARLVIVVAVPLSIVNAVVQPMISELASAGRHKERTRRQRPRYSSASQCRPGD